MLPLRLASFAALAAFSAVSVSAACQTGAADPYKDEPFVFEHLDTSTRMHADGTGETTQHVVLRVLSEGTARQFSVLSFSYASANETGVVDYVRVHKADGSTVETPVADAMEMPAEVSREAPMYSDIREKHVPVRSLSAGDRLEYQFRTVRTKAEAPNQFWGAEHFALAGVVLSETHTLTVPADTYVQVWSPKHPVTPVTKDGVKTWTWTSSQTKPSQKDENGQMKAADVKDPDEDSDGRKLPSVAWTTFHSWAEVGDWYRGLALQRAEPTAAIRAKADELTKDAKTPEEQVRALYRYVATQTRYVGISLGVGRYQPHAAADVMANQYGDCKDKDTLLEALLKAKGFAPAPALIGAGIVPVADVPTPAVFNHVITTLEVTPGSGRIWLDTTAEIAPYRVLMPVIRDQEALVVPAASPALLQKTPADPPFAYKETFDAVATLDKDGLLKGHMVFTARSDNELALRMMLQRISPSQWDAAMQNLSSSIGFGGKISNADFRQGDPAGPVKLAWDYNRPEFGDWKNSQIVPLFPVLEMTVIDKEKAPEHDIDLGGLRTLEAHTTITLPEGYRAELPEAVHVKRAYTTFDKTYRLTDRKLYVDRNVVVLQRKVPKAEWKDYVAFTKLTGAEDGEPYIRLIAPEKMPSTKNASSSHPDGTVKGEPAASVDMSARELMAEALSAEQRGEWATAKSRLSEAAKHDPKAPYLMSMTAFVAAHEGKTDEAIADVKAELRDHPDADSTITVMLGALYTQQKRYPEAVAALKANHASDSKVRAALVRVQTEMGDDAGALETLNAMLADTPDDRALRGESANALYRLHRYPDATAAARKAMDGSDDPNVINNNVYLLSEMKVDLPFAEEQSRRSVALLEKATADTPIDSANSRSFADSANLTASWDTLGYILLLEKKPKEAQPYFEAAWFNQQDVAVGNHLSQTYEALGDKASALRTAELALQTDRASASKEDYAQVKENIARWTKEGVKPSDKGPKDLQELRTFHLAKPAGVEGGGTVRVQVGTGGVADAQLMSGADKFKPLLEEAKKLPMPHAAPQESKARVLRDAVLYCGKLSSQCDFVFMTRSGIAQEGAAE